MFTTCFFFNDTATTEIYTLSLHDALPICLPGLPAGLVPGLLGRRQLPHAVLPHGELPEQPLREPAGQRPDPAAGLDAGPGRAPGPDRADPGPRRRRPVDGAVPAGCSGRGDR